MAFRPCPRCGKTISEKSSKCRFCGAEKPFKPRPKPKPKPEPKPQPEQKKPATRTGQPTCTLCGGEMRKKVVSTGNAVGILLALIVFILGVALLLVPVIGWVIGPLVMIAALFMGGKRRKVWKCTLCGHIADRA